MASNVTTDRGRLLVGRAPEWMVATMSRGAHVHRDAAPALLAMAGAAAKEGFALEVASGFRSFERQLAIWNQKARGERPLLDAQERPLELSQLSELERVHAMLRWSALPGASRHHWGTDLDVFDRAALAADSSPQLRRDETLPGGVFGPLHEWLDEHAHRFGFFRPYDEDRGGVSPEPWHLSYHPLAGSLQEEHSLALLTGVLAESELELKDVVLENLEAIYHRYVVNLCSTHFA